MNTMGSRDPSLYTTGTINEGLGGDNPNQGGLVKKVMRDFLVKKGEYPPASMATPNDAHYNLPKTLETQEEADQIALQKLEAVKKERGSFLKNIAEGLSVAAKEKVANAVAIAGKAMDAFEKSPPQGQIAAGLVLSLLGLGMILKTKKTVQALAQINEMVKNKSPRTKIVYASSVLVIGTTLTLFGADAIADTLNQAGASEGMKKVGDFFTNLLPPIENGTLTGLPTLDQSVDTSMLGVSANIPTEYALGSGSLPAIEGIGEGEELVLDTPNIANSFGLEERGGTLHQTSFESASSPQSPPPSNPTPQTTLTQSPSSLREYRSDTVQDIWAENGPGEVTPVIPVVEEPTRKVPDTFGTVDEIIPELVTTQPVVETSLGGLKIDEPQPTQPNPAMIPSTPEPSNVLVTSDGQPVKSGDGTPVRVEGLSMQSTQGTQLVNNAANMAQLSETQLLHEEEMRKPAPISPDAPQLKPLETMSVGESDRSVTQVVVESQTEGVVPQPEALVDEVQITTTPVQDTGAPEIVIDSVEKPQPTISMDIEPKAETSPSVVASIPESVTTPTIPSTNFSFTQVPQIIDATSLFETTLNVEAQDRFQQLHGAYARNELPLFQKVVEYLGLNETSTPGIGITGATINTANFIAQTNDMFFGVIAKNPDITFGDIFNLSTDGLPEEAKKNIDTLKKLATEILKAEGQNDLTNPLLSKLRIIDRLQ